HWTYPARNRCNPASNFINTFKFYVSNSLTIPPVNPDINYYCSRLDPVPLYHLRLPNCCNKYISLPAFSNQIFRFGMTDSDGSIPLQQQLSNGFSYYITAPNHNRFLSCRIVVNRVNQLHYPCWSTGQVRSAANAHFPYINRVKSIHIFVRVNPHNHFFFV